MYSDDSMIKAQKRVIAMQKKQLQLHEKSQTPKEYARDKKVDIGSIFSDLDILENDINLTKRDLDEYMTFRGNSSRNIPSMHSISPLSRKILSALKKVDFKEVPENQLQDLRISLKTFQHTWTQLVQSVYLLNHIVQNGPRAKDEPFRRLFEIAKDDFKNTIEFIRNNLRNVGGHNYIGRGIPKRFL